MQTINDDANINNGLVLLKFGAEWCGPCKRMAPTLNTLDSEFGEKVMFFSVDIDDSPELAAKFQIRSVPTLVFLKDGQEVKRVVGMSLIDPLRKILREL